MTKEIIHKLVEDEMKKSYLDYAMSVIVSRALPDVRDGLKPVHRRVLVAMNDLSLDHKAKYRKCAKICGDVSGNYHPHGEAIVYPSLVRMAQDFSLRYTLVDGQGNFGCFTGETKVKLTDGRDLPFIELVKEFQEGKRNFTYTIEDNGKIHITEIKKPRLTKKNAEVMKIILDNNEEIKCTLNHKFMLKNKEYKEAQYLKPGDSLMPAYFKKATKEINPEMIGYDMIFQPKSCSWDFVHYLADNWNIKNAVYLKAAGRVRHHINFDKCNNNPDNIKRMGYKEHWQFHHNLTSFKHKTDESFRNKLIEGRKKFWANSENRKAYSERLRERNLANWKNPEYKKEMSAKLSEISKRYIIAHPEVIERSRKLASSTMKRMWSIPKYKELFNEKIIASNKRRKTNLTGKRKFINICKFLQKNELPIKRDYYEKVRKVVFGGKCFTTWDNGFEKYFSNDSNLILCELNGNHKVSKIEFIHEYADVYDLTIDDTHNFALASGVFVHNSVDGDNAAAMRYCISGDSLMLTDKGIMPIKEISNKLESKINFRIMSFDQKKNKASKFFNSGKHSVIELETNLGYKIKGSHNHPLMCWTIKGEVPQIEWKLLEHIRKEDVVILSRGKSLFSKTSLDLRKYYPNKGFKNEIVLPSKMNDNLAFLLGALVSEGSFHNNQILFNNKDKNFYDKVKSIILSQFVGVRLYEREIKGNCKELSIYEQKVVLFLKNIGLIQVKSAQKEMPFSVLMSTEKNIQHFLRALFEGDGSVKYILDKRHNGKSMALNYNSKSNKLIDQLKVILLNFGIISTKPYQDKRNSCFKLIISGHDSIKRFNTNIGFFSDRKKGILSKINSINPDRMSKTDFIPYLGEYLRKKYGSGFIKRYNVDRYNKLEKYFKKLLDILDSKDKSFLALLLKQRYLFDHIASVKKPKEKENVYSIRVNSKCHSFVANGFINHNTEARMTKIADEILLDLEKETVDFVDNYDNTRQEPSVLPSRIPNLLINGSSGIAVGMATSIPPHNMREVCEGVIKVIDNPDISINELLDIIHGPDFPTGGIICGTSGIKNAYASGRGKIRLRGKVEKEEKKDRESLIITEIPYQVNKSMLIENIADLVRDKRVEGISDLRDESNRQGMRIVIELKKDANSDVVLNQLYTHTPLQVTFSIINLALVNNQPRILNLKDCIVHFIKHRKNVITRRTQFDLRKAEERAHILLGLKICLENIDESIKIIKSSKGPNEACESLMARFELTEIQARAILDMKLQKLTSLEKDKLLLEYKDLLLTIEDLKSILADDSKVYALMKKDTQEIIASYSDSRKTEISGTEEDAEILDEDLIPEESSIVTLTHSGYIKRTTLDEYRQQKRGGVGVKGTATKEEDTVEHMVNMNSHNYLLFFSDLGKVYWLKGYEIIQASRYSKGKAIINLLALAENEKITAMIPIPKFDSDHYLLMVTKLGAIKRTPLESFSRPRKGGIIALTLRENDKLVEVKLTPGTLNMVIASAKGMAVKFNESQVRAMGRAATGVRAIRLSKDDYVVGMEVAVETGTLLTITENGYGKRTIVSDYRLINRGGKGVINIKTSERNGNVVGIKTVMDEDEIMLISKQGIMIRMLAQEISTIGRNTQGVRIMRMREDDKVTTLTRVKVY
ncbi:DNA gyrase subunit A [Candidatus Woesearchaeota archaeon]|nr:DNA gyrase subunit A [Candidatus Woesearchaeota archaeon]